MNLNSKKYTLAVAKEIETLIIQLRVIAENNLDIIRKEEQDGTGINFFDKDIKSDFFFKVRLDNPTSSPNQKTSFSISVYPATSNSLKVSTLLVESQYLISILTRWIGLINEYNQVAFDEQVRFQKLYEQEFTEGFKIIEEDADTMPFDLKKQLLLSNFLKEITVRLEEQQNNYEVAPIIRDVKELNATLTISTKRVVVRKLGKILSRIRIIGIDLVKEALKDIAKEWLKSGIDNGWHFLTNHIHL